MRVFHRRVCKVPVALPAPRENEEPSKEEVPIHRFADMTEYLEHMRMASFLHDRVYRIRFNASVSVLYFSVNK